MMTLLFRAGLSLSGTLHYFGTKVKSSMHLQVPVQFDFLCTKAVLCLQPNMKQQHTSKIRAAGVQ